MNEFDFIRRYLHRQQHDADVILGIGDDAAVIRPRAGFDLHVSSDMLLAGQHFFADVAPADLAHKVLAVNVSDMAAMGAVPRWALLSVALPKLDETWLNAFCDGLFAFAARYGVCIVGGDTTKGDGVFNVTIIGETPQGEHLLRSGAQAGDDVWVSGELGLAAAALDNHLGNVTLPDAVYVLCEDKRLRPTPRVALGNELRHFAHAAQDISDGLAQDLGHILRASHVSATIMAEDIPSLPALCDWAGCKRDRLNLWQHWLLAGGDDYELVFTAPAAQRQAVVDAGRRTQTKVTRIGRIHATAGAAHQLTILDRANQPVLLAQAGFDHFA